MHACPPSLRAVGCQPFQKRSNKHSTMLYYCHALLCHIAVTVRMMNRQDLVWSCFAGGLFHGV